MLLKNPVCSFIKNRSFIYIIVLITSCKQNPKHVDVSGVPVDIKSSRLEEDLFGNKGENISTLKARYDGFFDLFCFRLTELGTPDTSLLKTRLDDFTSDADLRNIYSLSEKIYSDFSPEDKQLTDAFRHYKYFFPQKLIPRVITFISGFNYGVVATDSALGIGLDMYLGSDTKFYPALQFPNYKIARMRKEYIVVDALKGWAQSEWEPNPEQADLLSQMMYYGKILYFLDAMMPDAADSIRTGFTSEQLRWCEANEKNTWSFFIDQKILFSNDQNQVTKFINDGPTTNGFPKSSPGGIGQWMGWKIVKAYMKNNPEVKLDQLMNNSDYKKMLNESRYKPGK
jgi:gliding motility-associated lipoprotein GldB